MKGRPEAAPRVYKMIEYTLRRARTSRIKFSVRSGVVRVVAPIRLPYKLIDFYIQKNAETIQEYLAKEDYKPRKYEDGGSIRICGKELKIVRTNEIGEIEISNDQILIPTDTTIKHIGYFLSIELRKQISKIILDKNLDIGLRRIVIKQYDSKWGSCSPKSLNFNLKLVLAPCDVVKYVVIHEFSHILEPNHSRSFWKIVEDQMGDYKLHRKWLRDNGNKLLI